LDELKVTIEGHRLDAVGAKIPSEINSFMYKARTEDSAPVTRLELWFDDGWRRLSVEGQSPDQVDAIFATVREEVSAYSTFLGGQSSRFFILYLPLIIGLPISLSLLAAGWSTSHRRLLLLPASLCALLFAVAILLPTDGFLAGFSAVSGDASFAVRYGPQISLGGLIVGVVALVTSFIPLFIRRAGNGTGTSGP
jgi:hypothetical protein